MLLLSSGFKRICEDATIFLDTNAFIYGSDNNELSNLYAELSGKYRTSFVTLNSAEYEFTRGSQSLSEYADRREYVRTVAEVLSVNKLIDNSKNDPFSVAMSLVVGKKDSQYTDYLLAVALHAFNNGVSRNFILSADIKAFSLLIFTVLGVVTFDTTRHGVLHMNLYCLDENKYRALLNKVVEGA